MESEKRIRRLQELIDDLNRQVDEQAELNRQLVHIINRCPNGCWRDIDKSVTNKLMPR